MILIAWRASDWLGLAAAPAFAAMAAMAAIQNGPAELLCSAAHGSSLLGGMAPMYAMMSLFHSPPWLRLMAGRRGINPHCAAPARGN
jgi:hypothetical protein